MANYKLTQRYADNTSKDIYFTIPDKVGTYAMIVNYSDGTSQTLGTITVDENENTYKLSFSGDAILNPVYFTTPAVRPSDWRVVFLQTNGITDTERELLTDLKYQFENQSDDLPYIDYVFLEENETSRNFDGNLLYAIVNDDESTEIVNTIDTLIGDGTIVPDAFPNTSVEIVPTYSSGNFAMTIYCEGDQALSMTGRSIAEQIRNKGLGSKVGLLTSQTYDISAILQGFSELGIEVGTQMNGIVDESEIASALNDCKSYGCDLVVLLDVNVQTAYRFLETAHQMGYSPQWLISPSYFYNNSPDFSIADNGGWFDPQVEDIDLSLFEQVYLAKRNYSNLPELINNNQFDTLDWSMELYRINSGYVEYEN
ncbi:MAG: hypothetical protein K2M64_00315 [Clostridia bacterium]|nr:hypothetical protein [Clostridia bacterium]